MTLNSSLIAEGFRESNFTAQGGTLTEQEQSEGLSILQGLVNSFPGATLGMRWRPWWVPQPNRTADRSKSYPALSDDTVFVDTRDLPFPPPGSRIFLRNTAAQTINFQYQPQDGALMQVVDAGFTAAVTLQANGLFFGTSGVDTSIVLNPAVSGGSRVPQRTFVFRGDLAAWVQIGTLILEGEMPYPPEFDDFWTTAMAIRLSPRFGNEPKAATVARYKEMVVFARGWYRQMAEVPIGTPGGTMTEQTYNRGVFEGDPNLGVV